MCSNYRPATREQRLTYSLNRDFFDSQTRDTYPGMAAPVIILNEGTERICVAATFGMLPFWTKSRDFSKRTYNARHETVGEKPSFRHAWGRAQTCIVPARAIYEPSYESGKSEWWSIWPEDEAPMSVAGLWEEKEWGDRLPLLSFTMLTVNAAEHPVMSRFHKPGNEKRSVVMLTDEQIGAWLTATEPGDMNDIITHAGTDRLETASGRLRPD